jgi:hypothetical protein
LTSTRKLLRKERIIPQESYEARLPKKTTTTKEHGSLVITPLSDVPSSQVFVKVALLSDSDRENEWYIERILTDVALDEPLVMVPPESTGVGEPLESERGEPMEVEVGN